MKTHFLLLVSLSLYATAADFTTGKLFDAAALLPKAREEFFLTPQGKAEWFFAEPVNRITPAVVGTVSMAEGRMQFTLGKDGALIGWGNYEGKQALAKRVHLWAGPMTVSVTLRASAAVDATFLPWCDGVAGGKVPESKTVRAANRKRAKPEGVKAALKAGAEWQTVMFKTDSLKSPDGFELEFAGAAGVTVEMKSVRFSREMHDGWWRREFMLPAGKVWRAVGEVSMMCSLFINGREVPSAGGMVSRPSFNFANGEMFGCEAVDLAPYLRAGPNAIAIHTARNGTMPYATGTFTVVMESGEVLRLASDGSWKHSQAEPLAAGAKLSAPCFDDHAWGAAQARAGLSLNYKRPVARPAYAGLIVIENPAEPYLFFKDSAAVEMRVSVPPGIAAPEIAWEVQRWDAGKFATVKSGVASGSRASRLTGQPDFQPGGAQAGSPRAVTGETPVFPGQLPRGVYTFHAKLTSKGKLLEERIPEPFVVVGQVPMREVAGDTISDGLDLALEAEIDYTKPEDAIPWQEAGGKKGSGILVTKPTITERGGLRYRETGTDQGALISHRYVFKHPGDFYLMELEFPDDAERWFGVSCTSSTFSGNSKDGPAIWTGQKYPLSGKMKTMQWIYRPDPGPTAINLSNLQRDTTAAGSKLRISHIRNGLPALKFADAGARFIGQYTERTSPMGGFGKTFGFFPDKVEERSMGKTPRENDPVLAMCRELAHDLDAAEHYAMWLRFTGQNLHVMGCLQYFESNTGFAPPSAVRDPRLLADPRDVAVRVFGANGISVIASLEYVCQSQFIRDATMNDGQVALGADTPYLVDKDGRQPFAWLGRYGLNFLHPRVADNMTLVARDLNRKFAGQPNFLGVNFTAYLGGDFLPSFTTQGWKDPLASSFDDVTAGRFERETGAKLGIAVNDPQRFSRRAGRLLSPALKEKWLQWRTEKTRDFFAKMQREVGGTQSFISLYVDAQHAAKWQASGMPVRDFLRHYGWSPEVYQNQPGLWFPKWTHATQRYASMLKVKANELWPAAWEMSVGDEYNRTFDQPTNRASFIMTHWQEHETYAETLEDRDGWPRPFQMTYQAQANGDNARELFTQNLLTTDPEMVIWGFSDLVMQTGHEQTLREFARTLRALPKAKLMPALGTTLQTNLALREVRADGKLWFIAANPCPWPLQAEVYVENGAPVRDAVSSLLIAENKSGGASIVALSLKPYEVRAFRVDEPNAQLAGWKNQAVPEADLAHARAVITDAGKLLTNKVLTTQLSAADRAFLTERISAANAALISQHTALAWSIVSDWRFWSLARTQWIGGRPR